MIIHEIELILELLGPLLGFKETDREHVGEKEEKKLALIFHINIHFCP